MLRCRRSLRLPQLQLLVRPRSSDSHRALSQQATVEKVHDVARDEAQFDQYLHTVCHELASYDDSVSLHDLHEQFLEEAGNVLDSHVPYEERPSLTRRADTNHFGNENASGDGLVLVVHALLQGLNHPTTKTTVCSGFVVNASIAKQDQGDIIITCAHTLNEINRYMQTESQKSSGDRSLSFIITSSGQARVVTRLLSSMPRSDAVALEVKPLSVSQRLRALPLSPYPVYNGTPLLTHLFGSPDPPIVQHSVARTKALTQHVKKDETEEPRDWLGGRAYRRFGAGHMLGYRSYTGVEIEAGVSSILPHMLTSVLPTPGSSGGPIVNAHTGAVVGMTSGRRMDNRVEGERGWGCSAESIFEMFSLPGFMPTNTSKHAYP